MTTVKELEKIIFEARFLPQTDSETVRHAEVCVEVETPAGVFMCPVECVRVRGDGPTKNKDTGETTPDMRFLALRVGYAPPVPEPAPPVDDRDRGTPVEPFWHTGAEREADFPPDVIKVNPDAASRGMKSESNPGVGGGP
jgi:hypothetical protein